jgi:hypothetical protein
MFDLFASVGAGLWRLHREGYRNPHLLDRRNDLRLGHFACATCQGGTSTMLKTPERFRAQATTPAPGKII